MPKLDLSKPFYNISALAQQIKQTRQAIYVAIKKGKLKASRKYGNWVITPKDYLEYQKNRFSRTFAKDHQGNFVYRGSRYSVNQLADELGITQARLYYLLRIGKIDYTRHGSNYVIDVDDINKLRAIVCNYNYKMLQKKKS